MENTTTGFEPCMGGTRADDARTGLEPTIAHADVETKGQIYAKLTNRSSLRGKYWVSFESCGSLQDERCTCGDVATHMGLCDECNDAADDCITWDGAAQQLVEERRIAAFVPYPCEGCGRMVQALDDACPGCYNS